MIVNRQRAVRVALPPLEHFLSRVRRDLGLEQASLTICMVSDAEIARMNEVYRRKKGPTDVLSFPAVTRRQPIALSNALRKKRVADLEGYLGDIAISPATAKRYARKNGRRLPGELRILILHGVLHLLGYDHETDHGEMTRIENRLRKRFQLV
jgi:probable rRNA maturation factor